MSAECLKHGCHLVGHEFSEGGLQCPQCVVEERELVLRVVVDRLADWIEANVEGAQVHREIGMVVT